MLKKSLSLILIVVFCLSTLTGCNFSFLGKSLNNVSDYRIMNVYDRSLLTAKRIEVAVYINNSDVSTKTLENYSNEIINKYKDDYNGIMLCFYDVKEETTKRSYTPMAVGIWAPDGDFKDALLYHEYEESDWKLVVSKNTVKYAPTKDELAQYTEYISMEDKSVEEKLQTLNISDDEMGTFLDLMDKIKSRYEETIQR